MINAERKDKGKYRRADWHSSVERSTAVQREEEVCFSRTPVIVLISLPQHVILLFTISAIVSSFSLSLYSLLTNSLSLTLTNPSFT